MCKGRHDSARWSRTNILSLLVVALVAGGCTTPAPKYTPSLENVQALKNAGSPKARVADFADTPELNRITLRGGVLASPIGGSYGAYLADAIRQEFDLAKALDPAATVEVSGVLLKNDVNVANIITGSAIVEARVVVKKGGQTRFDKIKTATLEWDSSYVGAIAIPRGRENYPLVVQKLVGQIFADADFLQALK
jgi:hypothetical protein